MNRKMILGAHIAATIVAVTTIAAFFAFSLAAEINGDVGFIKKVKAGILISLPLLLVAMPVLKLTGSRLMGKSQNPIVLAKRNRMRFVLMNGIALIFLACFLYYRSHYQVIDRTFLTAQIAEFVLGLTNFVLTGLNIKSGLQLSGRLKGIPV